jgi:hypothetical protein
MIYSYLKKIKIFIFYLKKRIEKLKKIKLNNINIIYKNYFFNREKKLFYIY